MDKSAIKNFAVNARRRLREQVEQKAFELGITADEIKPVEIRSSDAIVIGGRVFNADIKRQRETLVNRINQKSFDQVMDEVAYTWFNRFIALRFMEVNDYLDSGVRVFSNREAGKQEPEILSQAAMIDLPVNKDKIYEYLDRNESEELFKYLIIAQCNVLNEPLPFMFEKIADYTELLFPDKLLNDDSIIREMVNSIAEEDWQEVEIIGWLYQYYISEKKDEVFAGLKKNIKISKENIPAATQLFTPAWIVKYMVENSLGKLWLESHPDDDLQAKWKYYLEPDEQKPEVQAELDKLINKQLKPEEIKVLDPACGSGHILVYAFEVLYEIYKKAGYMEHDIPKLILENNLYGLDIDDRASQLASFAVMMKAREKNRRILREPLNFHIYSIQDSRGINLVYMEHFGCSMNNLERNTSMRQIEYILDIMYDAKEYGSIINVDQLDWEKLYRFVDMTDFNGQMTLDTMVLDETQKQIQQLLQIASILSNKYEVVVTNPPYMNSSGMNGKLSDYLKVNYPKTKSDLFAVFIERCLAFAQPYGLLGFMTSYTWMFLQSYIDLRKLLLEKHTITSFIQPEYHSFFEEAYVPICSFTLRNYHTYEKGQYVNLEKFYGAAIQEEKALEAIRNRYCSYRYSISSKDIIRLPNMPLAYWISKGYLDAFEFGHDIKSFSKVSEGVKTGNNEKYLRLWFEVCSTKSSFGKSPAGKKWIPHHKGGSFRKWYGNNEYVINWENDGFEIRSMENSGLQGQDMYFKEILTWSKITISGFSVRYIAGNFLFDSAGPALQPKHSIKYICGALNCKAITSIGKMINPTLSFQVGNVGSLPIILSSSLKDSVEKLVDKNILISQNDWDSFETSWDFEIHPLIKYRNEADILEQAFLNWQEFAETQFYQLKANEEELNRIFIDIYGLQDELIPGVQEKDVTIRKADLERDIRSFISYAVGCMMGRYSLNETGLIYAGGEFNTDRYNTYPADHDAIIPVLDGDYFEDDIVARFIQFVKTSFGEKNLTANLDFIAAALGKKDSETSVERIRKYFLNDFYKDHLQVYKKRPIYWLFTSGKQKAFNALIYMHRYDKDTIARIRTDYMHELQGKYEMETRRLEEIAAGAGSAKDKRDAGKRLSELNKQKEELRKYDELLRHAADQQIEIDLDDGVAVNYDKFSGLLAKI